jgi:DNA-binding CsgD family transcriptional regulator
MTGKLVNLFRHQGDQGLQKNIMNEQEIAFLRLASTEMTYKEIAMHLSLSPRAVDNLRDHMFEKLEVRSRVGLVMYAIRQGLVQF